MNSVSAIVPVYQPDIAVLNRCLECVIPQVSEVIVTAEGNSIIPKGVLQHEKIRHVRTPRKGIGFGANVNFGARHAHGKWLLILNDDVFLNDDVVSLMLKAVKPDTGIVVHLLRYQDGRIFSTVCARNPGDKDFHHVDWLQPDTSIKEVTEVENACGASWLIRATAWKRVGGYDEAFKFYAEDNALSLSVRKSGWKILYTPHAKGWHLGHQSTPKVGNLSEMIAASSKLFHERWSAYLKWNIDNNFGNFDYTKESEPRTRYSGVPGS